MSTSVYDMSVSRLENTGTGVDWFPENTQKFKEFPLAKQEHRAKIARWIIDQNGTATTSLSNNADSSATDPDVIVNQLGITTPPNGFLVTFSAIGTNAALLYLSIDSGTTYYPVRYPDGSAVRPNALQNLAKYIAVFKSAGYWQLLGNFQGVRAAKSHRIVSNASTTTLAIADIGNIVTTLTTFSTPGISTEIAISDAVWARWPIGAGVELIQRAYNGGITFDVPSDVSVIDESEFLPSSSTFIHGMLIRWAPNLLQCFVSGNFVK